MEQQQWINGILESTAEKVNMIPDAKLFAKIQNTIDSQSIPMRWVWMAAATLLLLMALNVGFVFSKTAKENTATEVIVNEISKSNQLY